MRTELIGPELTPAQAEQFEKYFALLAEWNKVMNLTAIVDPDEVAVKHFADSLTLLPYLDRAGTRSLIDVGTGAGFPGIPLKIMRPELEVTLLDSLEKRVRFLNTVTGELGLSGIRTIHARAEDAGRDKRLRGQFDASAARAVAPMNVLCEYCLPFVRPDGMFYEYFPKFNGKRNPKVNFSYKVGGFDLSCCTANGPMGAALVPFTAFMRTEKFPVINMYVNGSASFGNMTVKTKTEFPQKSGVTVLIKNEKESTPILFRKAEYAYNFRFGSECDITVTESAEYQGYYMIDGDFSHGAVIRIDFDVKDSIVVSDGSVNPEGNGKLLLKHGPVVLSRDNRYTDITGRVKFSADPRLEFSTHGPGELVKAEYCGYTWIDYQSAGASWDEESDFITWNERA